MLLCLCMKDSSLKGKPTACPVTSYTRRPVMQDIRPPSPLWWPYTRCPIRIILSLSFLSVSLRWPTRLRDLSLPPHVPHVPHLPHVHRCRSSLWTLGTGTVSCRAFRWRGFLGVESPLKTCVYTIVYIYMCIYIIIYT